MKSKVNDCLKYWRVIRYFIKAKYGLTTADLDMLLFLYSEDIFSKEKFEEFDNLLSWDEDRFDRLLRDGWIEVFRRRRKKYPASAVARPCESSVLFIKNYQAKRFQPLKHLTLCLQRMLSIVIRCIGI